MLEMMFFYDGPLTDIATTEMETEDLIDAKDGYSSNMEAMRKIIKDDKVHMVVSNQIKLLDNTLLWDHTAHRPKLCLLDKKDGKWKPVGRFVKREIRYNNNLEKMYIVGEFADRAYRSSAPRKPRRLVGGVYVS